MRTATTVSNGVDQSMEEYHHILHVVDRTSGGVPVAVQAYLRNSPANVRHTVVTPFVSGQPSAQWADTGCEIIDLGRGGIARSVRLHRLIKQLRPTAVHAHSTFAGLYARLSVRSRPTRRVIYSPHCFAFERTDHGMLVRFVFRLAERALASNTALIAACSRTEAEIATNAFPGFRGRVSHIPNVSSIMPGTASPWLGGPLRVGMVGRISAQKDPEKFEEIIASLQGHQPATSAIWLGDGAPVDRERLASGGIDVSGWLTADDLRTELLALHVYFHSAAWEGFPIAVLDAHAARLPILVRRIPAFADVPEGLTFEGGLEQLLAALSSSDHFAAWAQENWTRWHEYLVENTAIGQREALKLVWSPE